MAIDGDETTTWYSACTPLDPENWMPCTGVRDPAVGNHAWFLLDLEYAACIGSVDWMFYDQDVSRLIVDVPCLFPYCKTDVISCSFQSVQWAPTEVVLQASLDGATFDDVQHISVDFNSLEPQTDYDGRTFSEPRWIYGSTFTSRRARYIRLIFLGDVQNQPQASYWHSIREIFVMTGCCDSSEMTFHRQWETVSRSSSEHTPVSHSISISLHDSL